MFYLVRQFTSSDIGQAYNVSRLKGGILLSDIAFSTCRNTHHHLVIRFGWQMVIR